MSAEPIVISDAVLAADTEGFAGYVGLDGREQHRAGLRAAIAAWVRERSTDAPLTGRHAHAYLSTACTHFRHPDCRLTCKYCRTACLCDCHATPASAGEPKATDKDLPDRRQCDLTGHCELVRDCPSYSTCIEEEGRG